MTVEQGANRDSYLFVPENRELIAPESKIVLPTTPGGFKVIEADPAWKFKNYSEPRTEEQIRKGRHVERHYQTMTLDDIKAMPVKKVAAKDCHLFLWTTGPFLMEAKSVMEAWGFKFSTSGFVWIKLLKRLDGNQYQLLTVDDLLKMLATGTGLTTRKNAEFCLLGRRGNPERLARDVHEVIVAPVREHSRKPDECYERIERYCPGPRLSLFSRQPREGWTVWGNEVDKFA